MIINCYKTKLTENPNITIRECRSVISKEFGIGQRTVSTTITEYNHTKTVVSPNRKRVRISFKDTFDEFDRNAVRQHVHSFWHNKTIPTLSKIYTSAKNDNSLPHISQTNLYHLLKLLDFEYCSRSRNSALIEKDEIVLWRRQYLEDLYKYRSEGRHVYYLDETWVNAGETTNKTWIDKTIQSNRDAFLRGLTTGSKNPSGKGKGVIVLILGQKMVFYPTVYYALSQKK